MASKNDYDKVVGKAAKRGRVIETVAASINANPKIREKAMAIARDPEVNRKRAAQDFDRKAKAAGERANAKATLKKAGR